MTQATEHKLKPASPSKIPLAVPPWGEEEINEAIDSLRSGMLTMGRKVKTFEEMFAAYIGKKHGVLVNSGSSANLLALVALGLKGHGVITPAVTWATTVFPISQIGGYASLVDVDLETYNISQEALERAITPDTKAIMPVHLLGNPCDMDAIMAIALRHKLYVIEDACEAHGAEYYGKKVGSFGDVSTFSFFFSHHISTIEGGIVLTDDDAVADRLRSLRAHGWIRDMSSKAQIAEANPSIDARFLFAHAGYNFRPTEIQGAFGMHQLPRLEGFIQARRENAAYWNKELAAFEDFLMLPKEQPETRHAWFAYPVMVRPGAPFSKKQLSEYLESRGLETRPIESGNMALQPAMKEVRHVVSGDLPNSRYIHDNAFFIGNHQGIGQAEREAIVGYFQEFMEAVN